MATYDDILDGTSYAPRGVDSRHTEPPRRGPVEIPVDSKPAEVPSAPIAVEKPEPQEKPRLSYLQLFEALSPDKPETPAERAAREKKEKREAVFSAIGDGISALSNLFFTTQYAPNSYDPSRSMSARTRERLDRLKAEREANLRAYREGYIRAASMDDANNRDNRNWRHQLEREAIADKRYEAQLAQEKAMAALNEQLRKHQITAAEYKAEQERVTAQFAEETEKLKQENLRAGVRQKDAAAGASKASASASYSRARYYNNGGAGGSKSGPTLQLEEDEPMRFGDDKDYDRAVMRLAPDYGVPTEKTEVTEWGRQYNKEKKKSERVPKKTRTVKRDVKDIAADIEREAAKRKKTKKQPNPMGGSQEEQPTNGKKKNPMS